MKTIDKNFFPGWVRKSISFTIDDGKLDMDKKFIDIVKPYGIKGTFNICNFHFDQLSPEGYREFYSGYEISNHCKHHPFPFDDGEEYIFKDEPLPENETSPTTVYKSDIDDAIYLTRRANGWRRITDPKTYIRLTRECTREIEEVFGKQEKMGFVWPFGMQNNAELFELLKNEGFYGLRATGNVSDKYAFAISPDRMCWSYHANNKCLLEIAEKYKNYPDDGELKAFIFGVHSIDFENSGNWCDLEVFAREFGNRPEKYWYASVGEIFAYEDAKCALTVTDEKIENNSNIALYITVDGERIKLEPRSVYML